MLKFIENYALHKKKTSFLHTHTLLEKKRGNNIQNIKIISFFLFLKRNLLYYVYFSKLKFTCKANSYLCSIPFI